MDAKFVAEFFFQFRAQHHAGMGGIAGFRLDAGKYPEVVVLRVDVGRNFGYLCNVGITLQVSVNRGGQFPFLGAIAEAMQVPASSLSFRMCGSTSLRKMPAYAPLRGSIFRSPGFRWRSSR